MFGNLTTLGVLLALMGALMAFSKILIEGVIPLEGGLPSIKFNGIKNLSTISQIMPILQILCIMAVPVVVLNISVSWQTIVLLFSYLLLIALHVDYEWNALNPGEDFGPMVYIRGSYPGPYIFGIIPVRYVAIAVLSLFLWFVAAGDYIAWFRIFLLSIVVAFVLTVAVWTLFKKQMEELRIIFKTHAIQSANFYKEAVKTKEVFVVIAKDGWPDEHGKELFRFTKETIPTEQRFEKGYVPRGLTPEDE